ncbi:MAG: GIY-YIG nuclease family protein [Oscillospiraceae bacterium]|nr:GIY-YIG nuclease family protein [Oscillospiraceae bacterium]
MGIFGRGRPSKYRPFTHSGKEPPNAPGVYRIRSSEGKVVYVGETVNLRKRMQEHIRITGNLRPGESFEFKEASPESTSASRREVERRKIARFHPERNHSAGGEGRNAK